MPNVISDRDWQRPLRCRERELNLNLSLNQHPSCISSTLLDSLGFSTFKFMKNDSDFLSLPLQKQFRQIEERSHQKGLFAQNFLGKRERERESDSSRTD